MFTRVWNIYVYTENSNPIVHIIIQPLSKWYGEKDNIINTFYKLSIYKFRTIIFYAHLSLLKIYLHLFYIHLNYLKVDLKLNWKIVCLESFL
jgi:hypothetical protein